MRYKKLEILAYSLVISIALVGCGDDSAKKADNIEPNNAPKIEVVTNSNAKEIKVKEKVVDKNQSKSYYYDYNIKSEYDPNALPANKDAGVRAKPRTAIDANMNIRSPYEKVQISMLVKKLSKRYIIKCSACHDDYANGVIGPSLLGRDSDYIYGKIANFKSGKSSNPLMTDLINMMSDDEIRSLADEIYNFNEKIKKMRENNR
jgi:cytochrome c553